MMMNGRRGEEREREKERERKTWEEGWYCVPTGADIHNKREKKDYTYDTTKVSDRALPIPIYQTA